MRNLPTLIDSSSDTAVMIADARGIVTYVNVGFTRLFGYQRDEAMGQLLGTLLVGANTDVNTLYRLQHADDVGQKVADNVILLYPKTGRPLWAAMSINHDYDAQGEVDNTLVMLADITTSKMYEVLQHAILDALAHEQPLGEVMTLLCKEVENLAPEVVSTVVRVDERQCLRPLASPSLPESYADHLDGAAIGVGRASCGTAAWLGESVTTYDIATDENWDGFRDLVLPLGLRACWSNPIKSHDGRVLGSFAFYFCEPRAPDEFHRRLIDSCLHLCALAFEREEARSNIRRLAFYDQLTGLANRNTLRVEAGGMLERVRRQGGLLALLFIDLDRFKTINDTQGHAMGNLVLNEVALRLGSNVRISDLVARAGGDEFVAVLPDCSIEQVARVADKMLQALNQPIDLGNGVSVITGASIGAALYPDDGDDVDTLMLHADMAMYQAKHDGRACLRFFHHDMKDRTRERVALETALGESLRAGSLCLHYQPKINHLGMVYGVESLARWDHPLLGKIPASRFIPLAEESHLINFLSEWAIGEACRQMAVWQSEGIAVPHMAVNVSALDFKNRDLAGVLRSALTRNGLQPAQLVLEMTEGVMFDDAPDTMAMIQSVRDLGVHLSLDDFGTGYSSLSYLHRLSVNEIKIDRSFVCDLVPGSKSQALVRTMLNIGRSLGLTVVAEGVETEAQRDFLLLNGCLVMQGYLYSHPMSPQDFTRWMQGRVVPA